MFCVLYNNEVLKHMTGRPVLFLKKYLLTEGGLPAGKDLKKPMTLKDLELGKTAVITAVGGKGSLRQHFLDMGVIPGVEVTLMKYAPMGDPMELLIHGYELTLRLADAEKIEVAAVTFASREHQAAKSKTTLQRNKREHPGFGEGGKYHVKADENPLPKGTKLTFALAGNQNCGKTTLFNQ